MKRRITTSAFLLAAVVGLSSSAIAEQTEFPAGPFQLFVVIPREILRGIVSPPWQEPKIAKPVPVPPIPVPISAAPPASEVTAPPPAPIPETPNTIEQGPSVDKQLDEHRPTSSYFGPQRPYRQQ
jgi:hypothetical protein